MKRGLLAAGLIALLCVVIEASVQQEEVLDTFDNDDKEDLGDNVDDGEDTFDEDDETEEIGQSSLISMLNLNGRQSICDGKAKGGCKKLGGSCVTAPFRDNCDALHGSVGKIKKKACKSKDCQCCLPPPSCAGKIKKTCSKAGGSCVVKPFKKNCKHGTLDKKSCQSKHCQCCIPGPTTTPGIGSPEPVTTKPIVATFPTQKATTTKPVVVSDPTPEPTTAKPVSFSHPDPDTTMPVTETEPWATTKLIIVSDPTPDHTTAKPVTFSHPDPDTTMPVTETEPWATTKLIIVSDPTPDHTTTIKPVTRPPVLAKYTGPQDKIWDDTQCSNAGNFLGKSLSECLIQCEVTLGCTAVNYKDGVTPVCVLRACELPVPAPAWDYPDYKGYSIITSKVKAQA